MFDAEALAKATAIVVREAVERATAPLLERVAKLESAAVPPPSGIDEQIAAAVAKAVAALPVAEDGRDVDMADVERMIAEAVAALPKPENGKDVDMAAVELAIGAAVAETVGKLPQAKDGVGLSGAVIDRDGKLILTLTDGKHVDLGCVVGKDVDMDGVRAAIKAEVDAIPRPKDGEDGFGIDDFDVQPAGDGRTVILSFTRGDVSDLFELTFPVPIYRDVWREKDEAGNPIEYVPGDMVTWGGSLWHCNERTTAKPDVGPWKLAVKKGRDGKDLNK